MTRAGLELAGVSKTYGDVRAVRDVSLSVTPGEVVALLGPNGAGKSTTVDMLLGLTPPDSGTVSVWGHTPQVASQQGYVGAMLQAGGLLSGITVGEMIELIRRISPHPLPVAEVHATARTGDLAGLRANKLSGGQTQRVRFALAIAGDPQLLVLDEPTAAMDVGTRRTFWAAMRSWTERGRTVLFATHYLEEADSYADRAVLMAAGRVVADGPVTEIKGHVAGRSIRVTLDGAGVSEAELGDLPGVSAVEVHGRAVSLRCVDSDSALRALLARYPQARDVEVTGLGLEDAFLALTGDRDDEPAPVSA